MMTVEGKLGELVTATNRLAVAVEELVALSRPPVKELAIFEELWLFTKGHGGFDEGQATRLWTILRRDDFNDYLLAHDLPSARQGESLRIEALKQAVASGQLRSRCVRNLGPKALELLVAWVETL